MQAPWLVWYALTWARVSATVFLEPTFVRSATVFEVNSRNDWYLYSCQCQVPIYDRGTTNEFLVSQANDERSMSDTSSVAGLPASTRNICPC